MDRAEIEERVINLLAEAVVVPREDVEDLRTDLREDLGVDSMDYVELITVLERDLGQQVEREELAYVRTVGDVVDLVQRLVSRRDAAADAAAGTNAAADAPATAAG
ncbi:acyl carrier protein [Streptomyces mobaraensis]|uniref:Acyl carrier protein n=1 Tax=Streptomyces mobaraensis TaxID=35621 RepID=A0A5N5W1P9_STRMB|nr:acyl carrier protein [Streptomyces mobaraensis]KAB7834672.1 acyl carrier protein [Streptomyces mobaraensis]